ncbi:hypothetical protein MTO96_013714 [Rhipicephalus appendiculatus]
MTMADEQTARVPTQRPSPAHAGTGPNHAYNLRGKPPQHKSLTQRRAEDKVNDTATFAHKRAGSSEVRVREVFEAALKGLVTFAFVIANNETFLIMAVSDVRQYACCS